MFNKLKQKQKVRSVLMAAVALLLTHTMTIIAFAAADLSQTVGVSGLTVNSTANGNPDWTGSAGSVNWSGTTASEKNGCDTTYTAQTGELVLTNNSRDTKILTFDYRLELNGGSATIDGVAKTSNGSVVKTLKDGDYVTISTSSPTESGGTTTVTLSNIKLEGKSITLTFEPAMNGSYTVDGTEITASTELIKSNTSTYALVATPTDNYTFAGWYVDDVLYSTEATLAEAQFLEDATIIARFAISGDDPLYVQAKVPRGAYTKDQLVSINSYYFHDSTNKVVADGSFPGNNTAYSKTAASKIKDKIDVQYLPSLVWDNNMEISFSGTAYGDYIVDGVQESYCYARALSDMIRIYAKENCNISFDYANSMTGGSAETSNGVYYYITTASNANVANVKSGTKLTAKSGSSGTIAVSKGNYLYILLEGFTKDRQFTFSGGSQKTMDFKYSASISNFEVEFNEKKDILVAGFRDNTGKALGSGKISVNSVAQTIGTDGNMSNMTFADQATVNLAVSTAPTNYVHIGWEITPEGGATTKIYQSTYSRTLTENVTVNAIFAPKTIITMGANGYSDASYTDVNGTALSGQYVARNVGCTEYYTSLLDAFSKTDVVVLLAGSTINGDWTIPSGKTFVIPFGMNDAGSTTPVMGGGMGADYCLVNLNGNLNVAGTLLVSAQQNQSTGATGGNPGHLVVASEKTINVSGSLYAYGPVTGAGEVETTSSAQIHETMEFSDNAPVMYIYNIYNEKSSKKVFPFSTMFINSIEIPVTYQVGATLTAHAAVRYDTTSIAAVPIIAGSGAMMNHTAGTITKYYDANAGQFVFRCNSGSTVNTDSFALTLAVTVAGTTMDITMNSADYYIPLSAPFRFEVAGNMTINDNYKVLPGMTIDVEEGGILTVASGNNLVFYRRNDYDYRGKHANSTEQWGYSERAYPLNPQRFNGVSYPFSFNNTNMGSAKLNVEGTLIVNGGLYVTDELQTDRNGITRTANGYNYLTGSGTIDMTNAATSLTSINEVMRASGTNDLKWDTVAVVRIKGLKADATANEAAQYESLSGVVQGSINENGLNVWSAPKFVAELNGTSYMSLAEALKEAEDEDRITLLDKPEDGVEIGQNVTIEVGEIDYKILCAEGWGAIDNEDGSFTIKEGIFKIFASNIKAGDSLELFFYIKNEDLSGEDYYAVITKTFADGRENVVKNIPYSEWVEYGESYRRFSFSDISAKEMTDEIYVTVYNTKGSVVSTKCTESIENYAIRVLSNTSDSKLQTVLVDMLNYGAACQTYFEYNETDLATARLSEEQQGYATTQVREYTDSLVKTDNIAQVSVVAKENLVYRVYISGIDPSTTSMTAYVNYTDHYNNDETLSIPGGEFDAFEETYSYDDGSTATISGYYVDIPGLSIADGYQMFTCEVKQNTDTEDVVIASITDSVAGYITRSSGNYEVLNKLLYFVNSAYEFFH